jgi:menaquinone-dependent protoporphyrinogen IX oxidase
MSEEGENVLISTQCGQTKPHAKTLADAILEGGHAVGSTNLPQTTDVPRDQLSLHSHDDILGNL